MKVAQYAFFYLMKPFITLYFIVQYNFKFKKNPLKRLKGPYLVIGHHVKNEDPLFVLMASRQLVRFLAGDANMTTYWKKVLFTATGMVPFKKKRSDMKSIRKLIALVKEKEAIGLYPEGGRTWDGTTDHIIPSTAKLVKILGIDVYITFYNGGYLTKPRWADYSRRGRLDFTGYKLFEGADLKAMSADSIMTQMSEALTYNEYDWQREQMIPFKGKNKASGIRRLLYKCPACNSEHTLDELGDDFMCTSCGQTYHINVYGFIEGVDNFDDTVKWHRWQQTFIPSLAESMTAYTLKNITYEITNSRTKERLIHPGTTATITKNQLSIVSDSFTATYPITDIFGFSFTLQDLFEFYSNDHKHRLIFDPKKHLSNVFVIDLLTQLKENSRHD